MTWFSYFSPCKRANVEDTIFVYIAVILFTNKSRFIPEFTIYRNFLHGILFLFLNKDHRLYEGITILNILDLHCYLKIRILNTPQKQRHGMTILKGFSSNFVKFSK